MFAKSPRLRVPDGKNTNFTSRTCLIRCLKINIKAAVTSPQAVIPSRDNLSYLFIDAP